jgi:hypothetical protein
VVDAFYLPAGEGRYLPTEATGSPWDDASQHGGPPAALLATCIDRLTGNPQLRLSRMTVEFLGAIPRRELAVEAHQTRPGRRVAMTDAALKIDGEPVVLARAWHIAVGGPVPEVASRASDPSAEAEGTVAVPATLAPPIPPEQPLSMQPRLQAWEYGRSIEWRFTLGGFGEPGPADVWTRVRIPLVAGEELTPLQRVMLVADSANGLSSLLSFEEWLFIPPALNVNLIRHPGSEWAFISARTRLGPDGTGLTLATLADAGGLIGTISQPLLVAPR